jgi:hypothetical protein
MVEDLGQVSARLRLDLNRIDQHAKFLARHAPDEVFQGDVHRDAEVGAPDDTAELGAGRVRALFDDQHHRLAQAQTDAQAAGDQPQHELELVAELLEALGGAAPEVALKTERDDRECDRQDQNRLNRVAAHENDADEPQHHGCDDDHGCDAFARGRDVGALDVGTEPIDEPDRGGLDALRDAFPHREEQEPQRRDEPEHDGQGRQGCYHEATRSSCDRFRMSYEMPYSSNFFRHIGCTPVKTKAPRTLFSLSSPRWS